MRARLRFIGRVAHVLLIVLYGLSLGLWVSLARKLRQPLSLRRRQHLTQHFMRQLSHALPLDIQVSGHPPTHAALWLSNHVSWLDIVVLAQLTPTAFVAKAEVAHWPVAGWLARQAGTLFIQRGAGRTQGLNQQLAQLLSQGLHATLFPEGTSSNGQHVLKFYARLLAGACDSQAQIQPVALRYYRNGTLDPMAPFIADDRLDSHLLRLLKHGPIQVQIQLLPCIDSHGLSRTQLSQQAHHAIAQALNPMPTRHAA